MKGNELKNGDVYIAFVRYAEDMNKDSAPRGKVRPVVIFEDPMENKLFACKVSSRIDKPTERKFGYIIQDWKEAGLKKPSIIACNRENIREIDKTAIHKYIGRLTERDIKGMLVKYVKVAQLELKREIALKQNSERNR
ncbi:hypothetical protein B4065_1466 [Caldibacillus thermoamylovorans]|uniref:type II toxin-antitoxin system PemK/MazF family toxin n=1 Tax=Caldibacillus thermoamylovorans TaxID=35841 RepID=UPI0005A4891C|nr:type II toxin-antitoxin system PemK/MazF family toxin [Caldibacillus thermoamylovorans]KIO69293.1 hypothetical protein B4065_1466 [Caldibacillus thermoamylovorans]